ncbi:MAG TPA: FlgO family outer membrane protein, partial [Chryseolinea sp.]|nr:FlgO family outer membrane protein [Chryseolinea sp.]
DLIYKAPGVDRPLRMTDEQLAANQERTIYRDQLNKVAIAIRSIMEGIQRTQQALPERKTEGRVRSLSGGRLWVTVLGMMLLLTALGTYLWRTYKATESQTGLTKNTSVPNAIAVLPFTNLANDPAQEYFSDGITEQIITELAQLRNLKVIARTSVMKFKATTRSIKEIGQELNVTHVLEGSIRRYGDRIRITAQLIDVSDESHLWAADYDEPFGDILVIQDAVSARIAKTLEEKLTSDEISSLSSQQLTHPEAYEHYLKGIYIHDNYYFSSRKDEHMRQSEKEFRAALKLEPQYVLALAGLGDLYDSYYGQGNSVSYREKRDSLATLAYALDQRLWYTRLLKALTFYDAGDSRGDVSDSAFHYFKLAYQAAPNNTKVCDQFAIFFQRIGLWYDCLPFLNKSIELNPLETTALNWRGYAYSQLGQNTVAEVDFRRSIKIDQDAIDGYVGLAMVKVFRKEADSAAHYIERAKKINADDYLLQYAESIVIANRRDKRALAVNKNQYGLILLGMYKEAVEVLANDPTQYEFIRDNPFYEPLRDREDYKQMMSELKVSYEVNKQRFKFAPTSDD